MAQTLFPNRDGAGTARQARSVTSNARAAEPVSVVVNAEVNPLNSDTISSRITEAETEPARRIVSQLAGDPDIMPILDQFVTRLDAQARAMREAFAEGRYEQLQRMAHILKGSGGSYGYPCLTEAAKALEDAAKARDCESAAYALKRVASTCRAVERGRSAPALIARTG